MAKSRQDALLLLNDWVTNPALQRHMLAVEAAMQAYAGKYGEDEDLWGMTGLLHDFDYEKFPEYDVEAKTGHPFEGVRKLEREGFPSELCEAILGHALYSGVPRNTQLARTLFAVDELCGFIVAVARMRPEKLQSLDAVSVMKKLKDKKFAEKVSRQDIDRGVDELGVDKAEHINFVIQALRPIQNDLGL